MLITTTDILQGVEISDYIGLVYGFAQNVNGGIGKLGGKLMEKTMESLKEAMQVAGKNVGADAVIGFRVVFEKDCVRGFGTAVKIK